MTKQANFFHSGTEKKLATIERYLRSYQKVLTRFREGGGQTIYFDGFAGTGELPMGIDDGGLLRDVEELDTLAAGSARRALEVDPWFSRYVFVEQSPGKAKELKDLQTEFADRADRIEVIRGNANEEVVKFCNHTDWQRSRAVMFLDPFGNQVDWSTIARIAKCNIDLWYLFPAHLGVNRQISESGVVEDDKARSLDRVFGASDWREAFLRQETIQELGGAIRDVVIKQANADIVTRFMIQKMQGVFEGGVLEGWLPLGRNGAHWYSLLFAWGNKSRRAGKIASQIANHLMTRK
jgi:three-Cys-motif partner protein